MEVGVRHPTICLPMKHRTEFTCKTWQGGGGGSILNQLNVIFYSFIFLCGGGFSAPVLSVQL